MSAKAKTRPRGRSSGRKVRWAVAGLGHIAQIAVLPAFAHCRRDCELVALLSSDKRKLRELGDTYGIDALGDYDDLEDILAGADVDALYVALPNHLHAAFTVRALKAGVHVLCEKPLAVTAAECERMIDVARQQDRRLMTAYRLHFERSNLHAIHEVASGKLGELRHVQAVLSLVVRDPANIRLNPRVRGGGPLYDLGIYCLNAARYLFRAEPTQVMGFASDQRTGSGTEARFAGIVRFPDDRELSFVASVDATPLSELRLIGTRGDLRVENAFDYAEPMRHTLTIDEKAKTRRFAKRDQFAPELIYFARCVRSGREPEPSGREGLADVRIIEALYRSSRSGRPVTLPPFQKQRRPDLRQEIHRPAVRRPPKQVAAKSPTSR